MPILRGVPEPHLPRMELTMTDVEPFSAKQWLAANRQTYIVLFALYFPLHVALQAYLHASDRVGSGWFSDWTLQVVLTALLISIVSNVTVAGAAFAVASRRAKVNANA